MKIWKNYYAQYKKAKIKLSTLKVLSKIVADNFLFFFFFFFFIIIISLEKIKTWQFAPADNVHEMSKPCFSLENKKKHLTALWTTFFKKVNQKVNLGRPGELST